MTKKEMFALIASLHADDEEIVNFCDHEIELLNAKNSKKSPTKAQKENVVIMDRIADALADCNVPVTVTELLAHGVEGFEMTNQKASALLRKMVADGRVVKAIEGKKAYFSLVA